MGYWVDVINMIGIYAILAMSLNVICGMTGQLQLGHAGFFAIGAYAAGLTSIYWFHPDWGYLNFFIHTGVGVIAACIFAVIIGFPCLRLSGDYLAIATLGFGEIVRITLNNLEFPGCDYTDGKKFGGATGIELPIQVDYIHITSNNPMANGPGHQFFEKLQTNPFGSEGFMAGLYHLALDCSFVWLFVIITFILLLNLKKSAIGRAFFAIREDEIAAKAMGVNLPYYKLMSFIICAAFAALGGSLYAHMQTTIAPTEFTLIHTIIMLLIVVLGGMGSFTGSIIAATILVSIPELLRFTPPITLGETEIRLSEHKALIFALLLILLIRWVPNGIMGMREGIPFLNRRKKAVEASND